MLKINEVVDVRVNQNGIPVGLIWRGQSYLVANHPIRWFARRDWWRESPRANRGIGAGILEIEMWRFKVNQADRSATFELMRNPVGNHWTLIRVYS